ncbi:MAG: DUF3857 domain-containing protein [Maribacter sp.]|uniref:DUF3857 domain-containing protein n=1 Tax=Maribacter sp. TaxID=1897614 RepID=UPI003297F502
MATKNALLLVLLLSFSFSYAQMPDNFGKVTDAEKNMTSYATDPDAYAVVLYERGDNYFKVIDDRIRLVKEYHTKIKILDEKGFDEATISILLRKSDMLVEKLKKVKAVTHNGANQFNVLPSEIFEKDLNEYRIEKTFTFPKLQKGSILEYSYTIISPFFYNFRGWDFQSHIPKLYSEFNAKIPGNYVYNRALIGSLKLEVNDSKLQKNCFHIDGFTQSADCEVIKYAMKDIPAFKVEEDFMLAASNYISRLDFELSQYNRFDGTTDKYTKTWKDVDREFRSDKNIGRQLSKKGFFESQVPEKLLTEGDELTRAKNIYAFVQKHYNWNEEYGIFNKARVKEAFERGTGNVSEINMSLINLLNAADIKANLMLLSTRGQGLPKKTHPVINDFNYAVAKVTIGGKDYLLDATNKYLTFGMLPFRALNHYGRVMDFKNESYWQDIMAETKNRDQVRAYVKFNLEEQKAYGVLDMISVGYDAVDRRIILDAYSEDEYLEEWEKDVAGDFEITKYKMIAERTTDSQVAERFEFEVHNVLNGEVIYFNPFLIRFFDKNPFTLEERTYPVDFGHPRRYKYDVNIVIPEGYEVQELPKDQAVKLGENLVTLKFHQKVSNNQIGIAFDLALNSYYLQAADYEGLKKVFKHVTDIQRNSLVVLKKM